MQVPSIVTRVTLRCASGSMSVGFRVDEAGRMLARAGMLDCGIVSEHASRDLVEMQVRKHLDAPAGMPSRVRREAAEDRLARVGIVLGSIALVPGHERSAMLVTDAMTRGGRVEVTLVDDIVRVTASVGREIGKAGFRLRYGPRTGCGH